MKYLLGLILLITILVSYFYLTNKEPVIEQTPSTEISSITSEFENIEKDPKFLTTIDIGYLRNLEIDSDKLIIVEELANGSNYKRYIASFKSELNTIYGLFTVPIGEPPEGGYPAIVFNHGYIPPSTYVTTEKYVAYVDYLARNGFVVFKIDMRGHGNSQGEPTGSYFSSGYTIDAISALKSLQKLQYVNKDKIGMWGHSMAGNLVLRAMLTTNDIKAGVIWAGAVYSYEDFKKYRLSDTSYVPRRRTEQEEQRRYDNNKALQEEVAKLRDPEVEIDFNNQFWKGISLTQNINFLTSPLQLHHSKNDSVVNIGYAQDLSKVLDENNKVYEFYEYEGGGHNIDSPYFETAMARTVEFFNKYLK